MAAQGVNTESDCAKAILPQGKPPQGNRARNASTRIQTPGTARGHQRNHVTRATPGASSSHHKLQNSESTTQASQPSTRIQTRSNAWKATPPRYPTHIAWRQGARHQATVAIATPTGASHDQPHPGKANANVTPEATLRSTRTAVGGPAPGHCCGVTCCPCRR